MVTLLSFFYSSHLIENENPALVFETRSGELFVTKQGERYIMDFPLNPPTQEVNTLAHGCLL